MFDSSTLLTEKIVVLLVVKATAHYKILKVAFKISETILASSFGQVKKCWVILFLNTPFSYMRESENLSRYKDIGKEPLNIGLGETSSVKQYQENVAFIWLQNRKG